MDKEDNTKVEKNSIKNPKGFQKGHAKSGGRAKGTPNKKTAQFKDKLGGFDTVAELKFLFKTCEDDDLKFAICKEFLKYEYPQRKAVDIETTDDKSFAIVVADKQHKKMLEEL